MHSRLKWLVYESSFWLIDAALSFGWSYRCRGRANIPKSGPVLLVANHQSFLDPIAIGLACPRHLAYLARKPLFSNKYFGGFLRTVNSVPIDQDGIAKDGLRNIMTRLQEGWPVLVFPEGARTHGGELQPLQPGVTLLIKKVKAAVVPVGIAGAYHAWKRSQPLPVPAPLFMKATDRTIAVSVGKPICSETLAHLPREEILKVLEAGIREQMKLAEGIRRR